MIQDALTVVGNRHVSGNNYKITLAGPGIAATAQPGQFVMVRPDDGLKPFLPRPFSIHRVDQQNRELALLYKVVGHGTRRLSELVPGNRLNVVGPLGKGFYIDQALEKIDLIAGGIGVAPLVFLADVLAARGLSADRVRVFIGGAAADDVLCQDVFTDMEMVVKTATDDGSVGFHGFVTEPFEKALKDRRPDMVFACGPPAMLRTVARIAAAENIPCQVSVESMMACGMGACLGCAIKTNTNTINYKHVCRDGPVFLSTVLDFDNLVDNLGERHRVRHQVKT